MPGASYTYGEQDLPKKDLVESILPLPSEELQKGHEQRRLDSYLSHIGTKLRKDYPEAGDANDREIIQAFHQLEAPDSSPEEFGKALDQMYPGWTPPKEPSLASRAVHTAADFPVSILRDVIKAPVGVGEEIAGISKLATAKTPEEEQAAKTQIGEAKEHLIEGGAFWAGAMVAGGIHAGLEMTPLKNVAQKFLPQLAKRALVKGPAEMIGFGATSRAFDAGLKGKTLEEVKNEVVQGLPTDIAFGMGTGVASTTLGKSGLDIAKFWKVGKSVKEADTAPKAKAAAAKTGNIFRPEWIGDDKIQTVDADKFAKDFVTENSGKDVAESKTGQQVINTISKKIKDYQNSLQPVGTGFLPGERPEEALNKKQLETKEGKAWEFSVETKPGTIEVHNVFAPTIEEAFPKVNDVLKATNGSLIGEVEPQMERRTQVQSVEVERRKAKDMTLEEIQKIIPQADEQLKKDLAEELKDRPLGMSPYRVDNPVDVSKNSSWTRALNESKAKIEANPKNIKARDEYYRAKQNFEAWQKHDAQKRFIRINREAKRDLESIDNLSDEQLASKFSELNLGQEVPKDREALYQVVRRDLEAHEQGSAALIQDTKLARAEEEVSQMKPPEALKIMLNPESKGAVEIMKKVGASDEEIKNKLLSAKVSPPGPRYMIGRGAHGQVRVEFPDESHAAIYAYLGRVGKLFRGEKPKYNAVQNKEFIKAAAKGIGVSEKEAYDLARTYREQVNEMVKGKPTYEDSNEIIKAPNISQKPPIAESRIPDIDIRKLQYTDKIDVPGLPGMQLEIFAGGSWIPTKHPNFILKDYPGIDPNFRMYSKEILMNEAPFPSIIVVKVKSTEQLPTGILYPEIREAMTQYFTKIEKSAIEKLNKAYEMILIKAPNIGKWKLVDNTQIADPNLINKIIQTPSYIDHLASIENIFQSFRDIFKKHPGINVYYDNVELHGLTTSPWHLGINISGPKTIGSKNNLIVINPWVMISQVKSITPSTPTHYAELARNYSIQLVETLRHELAHQEVWGHGPNFVKTMEAHSKILGNDVIKLALQIEQEVSKNDYEFLRLLERDSRDIQRDLARKKGTDLLNEAGTGFAKQWGTGSNPNVFTPSSKGWDKSREVISKGGKRPATNVSSGPPTQRDISTLIQFIRRKLNIPEKAEFDPMDFLPAQRLGLEEINVD